MLIFTNEGKTYIFIHIPKNSGKYIRDKIKNDKNNEIITSYWDIEFNLDLAHIPYMKKDKFINHIEYNYFTYTRCPYHRMISAFFYLNPDKTIPDFKHFVKNTLPTYKFDMDFNYQIIHYYPQYLFVCDESLHIPTHIKIDKIEDVETPKKYNLPTYYCDECISMINHVYHKDFICFDYPITESLNRI
jgi:hypothetical protein